MNWLCGDSRPRLSSRAKLGVALGTDLVPYTADAVPAHADELPQPVFSPSATRSGTARWSISTSKPLRGSCAQPLLGLIAKPPLPAPSPSPEIPAAAATAAQTRPAAPATTAPPT